MNGHTLKNAVYSLPGVRDVVSRHRAVVAERDELKRRLSLYERHPGTRIGSNRTWKKPKALTADEQRVVDSFHELYYRRWQEGEDTISISWFGHRTLKCPLDLWTYQEIIVSERPDLIIECGTRFGGSAYYLASLLDLIGNGRVVTIDIDDSIRRPGHHRIDYVSGSSTAKDVIENVRRRIKSGDKVMAILDSDHTQDHVTKELEIYAPLVSPGQYLVVEDTNINGHPAYPEFGPGPMEALNEFLESNAEFEIDTAAERFMMTLNPRGFLRKKT